MAHRNGTAVIRALGAGSASLAVRVLAASAGVLEPATLTLSPGGEGSLDFVVAGGGERAPASAVTWYTSDPAVALVENGRVRVGQKIGVARLTALYGEARAEATVNVVAGNQAEFVIRPDSARLRRGQFASFDALSRRGPLEARWTTRNPQVLPAHPAQDRHDAGGRDVFARIRSCESLRGLREGNRALGRDHGARDRAPDGA